MIEFGVLLENLGWEILPISFGSYFILGLLSYIWNKRYMIKPVKALWYILNAIMVISGDVKVDVVAVMILFFEAFDSVIDYFEEKKNLKK